MATIAISEKAHHLRIASACNVFAAQRPHFLAKDCLLHTVEVWRAGNTSVENGLGFITNKHITCRAFGYSKQAGRCVLPHRFRWVSGFENTPSLFIFALSASWALLTCVLIGVDDVEIFAAGIASPELSVVSSRFSPSRLTRKASDSKKLP